MDDIKGSILKFAHNVTKTSNEFIKSTKLQISLSSEEENLKKIYMDIGKKVHEIYQYGGTLGKFFDDKYSELEQQESKILELRKQLDLVKSVKNCANCGASVARNAEFCPKCGNRMGLPVEAAPDYSPPSASDAPSPNSPAPPPEKTYKICANCKSKNDVEANYCLTCGRLI
ncbi:MAG: zinc ribbon domain-containing protein [Clostridiales bacterium]|nr:zinc ribbon domain-containing protein [Clostridiales bacterium]